ncbi:RNA polymerase factor sigma-54 [Legionella oakridgensis]|uniref:RNA polymerase sigma-54 factor n=2 Tax=Legionella oakridgensis TaxID=29423 RepID=W0B747_9GAMM|nr:RNA polymerase factor sigma-54 [Legionella oakridgensis]AHE66363.1 RNA polymerase sigma-54 factor RpoN [Legionella oakridgensis ATCC 33761 = DSM 21215]ETO93869.1 RNA polymerase, sigma 54 subunit, RpoN/SigL [Legionella oakridgensis RV-2-2007]KTD44004.1 RNA polymerase sigma-54 factor (sigma-L) [Legionella oakridgensis]STY19547.1 RNA polymerase sigma-54 factor (sigma-L) [Legionella longbeachae]
MKPSLQLGLASQLSITPQLQQAIRLLKLSTLDLRQEIQQQVESNPMLESTSNELEHESLEMVLEYEDDFVDFQWSPLYSRQGSGRDFKENSPTYEPIHRSETGLQDHLRWQLNMSPISDIDRMIAEVIIDAIDDNGFLTLSLTDIHSSLNHHPYPLALKEIEVVLHRIQRLDPLGCGARNLAETLLIQLEQLPQTTLHLKTARQIMENNLELLGRHKYRQLMKIYHIDKQAMENILDIIQHLNPKPGSAISREHTKYIIPDLIVEKKRNHWQVSLSQNVLPHLSINTQYASLIQRGNNHVDNKFLKNNLQEARWFLKSIQSWQKTLLKVARYIVDYQQDFLEFGEEAMKPLILNEAALALNMHESTISRITTQKFIHTPRGVFELKYFFSNHIPTMQGGECSPTAIRALIKKFVAHENPEAPLSDGALAKQIAAQGIQIARRTISKYREEMRIPPVHARKSIRSNSY